MNIPKPEDVAARLRAEKDARMMPLIEPYVKMISEAIESRWDGCGEVVIKTDLVDSEVYDYLYHHMKYKHLWIVKVGFRWSTKIPMTLYVSERRSEGMGGY